MPSTSRSPLIPGLLAVLGCGFESSNAVDPTMLAVDVPVRLERVRVRESLVAGLGTRPVALHSGQQPNARGVAFEAVVTGVVPEHAGVLARLVCAVDGHAIASQMAFDASGRLARASVGARVEGSEVLMPGAFIREIPDTCEVRFAFTISPPLHAGPVRNPAPVVTPIATVCFADDVLRDGPCTAQELPRAPASGPAPTVELEGELVPRDDGGLALEVRALATAGVDGPERASVRVLASCTADGVQRALPLMMWLPMAGLQAGESVAEVARASTDRDGGPAPQQCAIEALLEDGGGARESLARWCVRQDGSRAGDCP